MCDMVLGLDYYDDGSGWSQEALFIGLVTLPIFHISNRGEPACSTARAPERTASGIGRSYSTV